MTTLVTLDGDSAVTNTFAIAEGTESDHASVIKLVRKHLADLEEFGLVRFEIRPRSPGQHGGGDTEYAILNERQATLLLTYMRNTLIVRTFKKRLVHAFFEMAQKLARPKIKDPRLAALVEALERQDALEQEQARQSTEIARLQEDLAVVEARTQPENKHFTVMGYANLIGVSVDIKAASTLGRRCAALSKERGTAITDVPDPRFGRVHAYHESILQEVLQESR